MSTNPTTGPSAQQQAAIYSPEPRILCIAGPGSGKSFTLIRRIERLIREGTAPRAIVAITYTNAAAAEVTRRLDGVRLGFVGTIHAFVLMLIQAHYHLLGFKGRVSVVDEDARTGMINEICKAQKFKGSLSSVLLEINKGIPEPTRTPNKTQVVAMDYYATLRRNSILDFDSILTFGQELLAHMPHIGIVIGGVQVKHLFVDEFQDCSNRTFTIVTGLPVDNRFFVGDPDQSIFSFQGANIQGVMSLANNPQWTVLLMEHNYRSRSEICESAQRLIEHATSRVPKATISVSGTGGRVQIMPPFTSHGEERRKVSDIIQTYIARGISPSEIAVLFRLNFLRQEFANYLRASGIPVAERSTPKLPEDWARMRLFLSLLSNPLNDTVAYTYAVMTIGEAEATKLRLHAMEAWVPFNAVHLKIAPYANLIVAIQSQGFSHKSREAVQKAFDFLYDPLSEPSPEDVLIALQSEFYSKSEISDGVKVSTIHSAKGLEFTVVILPAFEQEIIPGVRKDMSVEEDRRLAYVAVTRAKECLIITSAVSRNREWTGFQLHMATPSQFVKEMQIPDGHLICPGCGNEIDPYVCHCGDIKSAHNSMNNHGFVPMGCDCGRVKLSDLDFAPL